MIRAVDNKALDLSKEEFDYYLQIIKEFGENIFQNLFETEENTGFITLIKPNMNSTLPLGVIFFLFNVSLNQRIRDFEQMKAEFKLKMRAID